MKRLYLILCMLLLTLLCIGGCGGDKGAAKKEETENRDYDFSGVQLGKRNAGNPGPAC